jgi:hypothetical protein
MGELAVIPSSGSISDQKGRFAISGLPPGDYLACAIDFIETGQEYDLEFLERIRTLATQFSLGEGEAKALTLRLRESARVRGREVHDLTAMTTREVALKRLFGQR